MTTHQQPARLGWPRLIGIGVALGAVVGAAAAVAAAVTGYPGWAELTWQLATAGAMAVLFLALSWWGIAYGVWYGIQWDRPAERRKPIPAWAFDLARPPAVVAAAITTVAVLLTIAFGLGTGDVWAF